MSHLKNRIVTVKELKDFLTALETFGSQRLIIFDETLHNGDIQKDKIVPTAPFSILGCEREVSK